MGFKTVLLVTLTLYTTVLLILCWNLPFSQIFRMLHSTEDLMTQVDKTTELHTKVANEYFLNLDPKVSDKFYSDRLKQGHISFALGIISVQRVRDTGKHESFGYLKQSASSVDKIMKHNSIFNASLAFICNVDTFPSKHTEAIYLYQFMPYTERYGDNSLGIAPVQIPATTQQFRDLTTHLSIYHKETLDYTFCLLSAAALNPQYIILIEDDTLPHKDFPAVLEHLINSRLKFSYHNKLPTNFTYVKLFYPTKWQGFAFEFVKILDLLSWSIVGASVLSLLYLVFSWKSYVKSFNNRRQLFILFFCLSMVTCWLLGRQNVNELRRLSKYLYRLQKSEGCCTQAMLYPVHIVDSLSQFLTSTSSSRHTDLYIMDFSQLVNSSALQVEPNLFMHVGLHTSLSKSQKHPEEFIIDLE